RSIITTHHPATGLIRVDTRKGMARSWKSDRRTWTTLTLSGIMCRFLIINADDFGASEGINRGILECHARGVLTSTSLMCTGRAGREAAAMTRDYRALGIGRHGDVWGEDEREFDLADERAVRDEFRRQLDEFHRLMGRPPTHIDSHRHAHRDAAVLPLFHHLV